MDNILLYLIRHGRTELNQRNMFRGNVDIPLDKMGKKDAEEAADILKNTDPASMVSSDKKRAVETAKIFKSVLGLDNIETPELRAWNIGKFSGKERNKKNNEELQQYIDNPHVPVPGGESLQDFRDRVSPILDECFEYAKDNGIVLVIAHSSVIHELGNILTGSHTSLLVDPGGIVAVGFDGEGNVVANRLHKPAKPAQHAENVS